MNVRNQFQGHLQSTVLPDSRVARMLARARHQGTRGEHQGDTRGKHRPQQAQPGTVGAGGDGIIRLPNP